MLPLPNRIADQLNLTGDIIALLEWDNSVFDNFTIPDGMDKQTAIDTIMMECADRPLLHPSPEWMKWGIGVWCKKKSDIWKKLFETTNLEYNPIYNYDRTEEETENRSINRKRDVNATYEENGNTDSTEEHKVSAENSDTYEPDTNDSINQNVDTSGTNSTKEAEDTGESAGRKFHAYGNIGVTTTQKMIREQRDIVRYSVYEEIAVDFAREFCLYVW